jgi:aspartyl-tRNA(Asn)/glutamyl-tRNA(Gln) amidotransferase subunit B
VLFRSVSNWLLGPVKNHLNETGKAINEFEISPEKMAELAGLVETGKLSFSTASAKLFPALIAQPEREAGDLATAMNLLLDNNEATIRKWVDEVLSRMPDKVSAYKGGKKGLIGLFLGEVKKMSGGRADMPLVTKYLEEKLNA